MLPDDIVRIIFDKIPARKDAASLALSCKHIAMIWKNDVVPVYVQRWFPQPVADVVRFKCESDTMMFIKYLETHTPAECSDALGLGAGGPKIRLELVLKHLRDAEKRKVYEILVTKSGLLGHLRTLYDVAVIEIIYARGHKVSWYHGI
jgi:hypothetical protein